MQLITIHNSKVEKPTNKNNFLSGTSSNLKAITFNSAKKVSSSKDNKPRCFQNKKIAQEKKINTSNSKINQRPNPE